MEMIEKNSMDAIDAPKGGNVIEPQVWEKKDVRAFLKVAKQERLFALFYILLTTGMRIGEALGLQWTDLGNETLTIERSLGIKDNKPHFGPPKTDRGFRVIYLSADELQVLAEHKETQLQEQEISPSWQNNKLIFCSEVGTPISKNNLNKRSFRRIMEQSGVPRIRLHDLRHTYITLARDAGIDAEIIADRVGQDVRVTLKIYSQVTEARKRKAAISLEELLNENED